VPTPVWQIALQFPQPARVEERLYDLQLVIELDFPVHVASLSTHVAAYKVHGAPEILNRYYPELKRRDFLSAATIGHSRFSTNTLPTVLRAQPFSLLGHNGEINTIARLREEALMLGIPLPPGGSDSQDLNRTLEGLIRRFGLTLFEAMEMVFPPIVSETDKMAPELASMYDFFRRFLTASAQGPAAIIARHRDACIFSVDAMGLRPLWFGETDKEYFASSEVGSFRGRNPRRPRRSPRRKARSPAPRPQGPGPRTPGAAAGESRPLSPPHRPGGARQGAGARGRSALPRLPTRGRGQPTPSMGGGEGEQKRMAPLPPRQPVALAWKGSDVRNLKEAAKSGTDPIASLGYDGPLAALSLGRQNLSDYFKEQVAVVTNPAIDRERETEHFSTRVTLGARPNLRGPARRAVRLEVPLLTGGRRLGQDPADEPVAAAIGSCTLEALLDAFGAAAK
jgi:glutamate synthase (NADPH/NADH) large chain